MEEQRWEYDARTKRKLVDLYANNRFNDFAEEVLEKTNLTEVYLDAAIADDMLPADEFIDSIQILLEILEKYIYN